MDRGPPFGHRVGVEDAVEMVTDAGFLVVERGFVGSFYLLVSRKS